MSKRPTKVSADDARRIVALTEALEAFPALMRKSRLDKPRREDNSDRLAIIISVESVCASGSLCCAAVELDMVSGRLLMPALRQIITDELRKLRAL